MSPAELAKLEHAFATDPASESYKPLAEAYLGMGRFMEAMVVCKKGVKAHPTAAEPRLLLSRVYAEQGKDKKALEELQGALQVAPQDKQVLRMTGALQLKTGEAEAGKANLLKAYEVDPADAETQAVLAQWKVDPPRPAAPAPAAPAPLAAMPPPQSMPPPESAPTERNAVVPPSNVPMAGPGTRRPDGAEARPVAPNPQPAPAAPRAAQPSVRGDAAAMSAAAPQAAPARTSTNGVQSRPAAPAPGRTVPRPAAPPPPEVDEEDDDEEPEARARPSRRPAKSRLSRNIFIGLLALGLPAIVLYQLVGQWQARRDREIKKALAEATEQLKHDSYASYQAACKAGDKALELDPSSVAAHGIMAYAYAIRWVEHGGGDSARKNAEEHLEAGQKGSELSAYLYAAQAQIKAHSGKDGQAAVDSLKELQERVKAFDSEGRQSPLLYLTLGLAQIDMGDLEGAGESLEKAQSLSPDDARIYAALGNLYRRRGQDGEAAKNFDLALRYEKDHPDSLLGASLLVLDQERPRPQQLQVAAKMLKKLIDSEPPPSPRQLATAHLARSLLISRVAQVLPDLAPDGQKLLSESTGVPLDKSAQQAEVAKSELTGFTLDKQNPELYVLKARRLVSEGNVDAAAAEVRTAIDMAPSRAMFSAELARVLMQKQGGEQEAAAALQKAMRAPGMGKSPKLKVLLGNAYRRMHKPDEAVRQYQEALSDPKVKNPEARLALGSLLREREDYANAQTALEKAEKEYVGQPSKVAAVQTELGRVYEARKERDKAEQSYTRALTSDPEYAPAYYFYARFLASDPKDSNKAKATAQEYLHREPHGEFAMEAQRLVQ